MAAKKKKLGFTVPSQGREPPALDDAKLAEIERVGMDDPYAANQLRMKLEMDPKKAAALIERLAFDAGEVHPNHDYGAAKTKKEREAVEAELSRLVRAKFQREQTIASLFRLAAHDLAFQSRAFAGLAKLPKGFRDEVLSAIAAAPKLVPELADYLRDALRDRTAHAMLGARIVFGADDALQEIGGAISSADGKNRPSLEHAKMLVQLGTGMKAWTKAPDAWRKILEPLVALMDGWDPQQGDLGRARWQLGAAAQAALTSLEPEKEAPAPAAKRKKKLAATKPPIDKKLLRTDRGREKALDELGAWIVTALAKAGDDAARAAIAGAIGAFYDVREAADQERGEYAGHFFMVDAVGLDESKRPVPWNVLREKVGDARLDELSALFDEVQPEIE
jgi:hypothetical protein